MQYRITVADHISDAVVRARIARTSASVKMSGRTIVCGDPRLALALALALSPDGYFDAIEPDAEIVELQ